MNALRCGRLRTLYPGPILARSDPQSCAHPEEVAIDYGFTIELCTPHPPQQKGAVENLVGFVKRSFFRARRFQDREWDLRGVVCSLNRHSCEPGGITQLAGPYAARFAGLGFRSDRGGGG